jgi:hypothetical protein
VANTWSYSFIVGVWYYRALEKCSNFDTQKSRIFI